MPIHVLIVDDHQLVIDGLKLMFDNHQIIQVVAEAYNGQEAIDYVSKHDVDIVMMDLNMPHVNGLEACENIKNLKPEIKIIILSMISEHKMVKRLMEIGANGYMLKNSGQEEIIDAIIKVHNGINYFDQAIVEMILQSSQKKEGRNENLHPSLSRREKEILQLIINEYTTAEIANKLSISFGTVESHRRNMISKLGVRNTAGLVSAAYKYALV